MALLNSLAGAFVRVFPKTSDKIAHCYELGQRIDSSLNQEESAAHLSIQEVQDLIQEYNYTKPWWYKRHPMCRSA